MILAEIVFGAPSWVSTAVVLTVVGLGVLAWSYSRASTTGPLRAICALLKAAAIVLVAFCLVEPLQTGDKPKTGSNLVLVLADNSRSLQMSDPRQSKSRGEAMQQALAADASWLRRLREDYDVRQYTFDTSLRAVKDFDKLPLDGEASTLAGSLTQLADRYRGRPLAAIVVLTDGNATDLADHPLDGKSLPPVYPVSLAGDAPELDVSLSKVVVSQTNFETAPVTLDAEIEARGITDRKLVVRIIDDKDKDIERRVVSLSANQPRISERFLIRPENPGVSFYRVQVNLDGEEKTDEKGSKSREATLANNSRLTVVDRGGGPYRVLYVSGTPNWEFKFLRRALAKDDEVQLVGLLRVARKEPKFTFLGHLGERSNPLFRGFDKEAEDTVEQYDQPVMMRLGMESNEELRGGFPLDAEDLFRYQAVILDDIEAAFFTQDQLSLLQQFVSQRGGSLLMLGGKGSFAEGGYGRTPVGEMLPVYLDRRGPRAAAGEYRLRLTREGWLQPWVRLRTNEPDERQRLSTMPAFNTLNVIGSIKPGASVLAEVESRDGAPKPALVVQSFGRGRAAALLLGDLWQWELQRPDPAQSDMEKAWRQTVRWLVADVPQAVEVETRRTGGVGLAPTEIVVRIKDKGFAPLDNAQVKLVVTTPDKRKIELLAEGDRAAGEYRALFAPRMSGSYLATAQVTAADGSPVGEKTMGWVVNAETDEFSQLGGNATLLARLAAESQGEVLKVDDLDRFVRNLPQKKSLIVEKWTYPLWHQWSILGLAIACLVGEWGLRRWRGLA